MRTTQRDSKNEETYLGGFFVGDGENSGSVRKGYSRIDCTTSPASGAGNGSEARLM